MNRIGSAVNGLAESWVERCEKSKMGPDAKEGCYFLASPFAMTTVPAADNYLWVRSCSNKSIARGSLD
jgi:hypothetical protein